MSEKIVSAEELERSLAAIERRLDGADNWAVKNVRAYVADLGLLAAGFRDRGEALSTLQREADGMREALLTTRAIVSEGAGETTCWNPASDKTPPYPLPNGRPAPWKYGEMVAGVIGNLSRALLKATPEQSDV